MRNWDIRAREGRDAGEIGVGGGRVNSWVVLLDEAVGTYVTKRYEVE